jgi:general secretion pathway protein G
VPGSVPHRRHKRAAAATAHGWTLIELAIAVALVGVLSAIAWPSYTAYLNRVRITQAIADISGIELLIARYEMSSNRRPPVSLAMLGSVGLDPWGNPYQYLDLTNPHNQNDARMDHNLHPINSDFDLYSMGADGHSVRPLTANPSRDDIVRGRNGRFVGLAVDF